MGRAVERYGVRVYRAGDGNPRSGALLPTSSRTAAEARAAALCRRSLGALVVRLSDQDGEDPVAAFGRVPGDVLDQLVPF